MFYGQSTRFAPAVADARIKSGSRNIDRFRPISDSFGASIKRNSLICPVVFCLSFFKRPSNVSRFIVSVIINSINAVTIGRAGAQIGKEFFERGKSELNSATAIVGITDVLGIFAPLSCRIKDLVFLRVRRAVFCASLRCRFRSVAAARFCCSFCQASREDCDELSAPAATKPSSMATFGATRIAENSQQGECSSGQVTKPFIVWVGLKMRAIVHVPILTF